MIRFGAIAAMQFFPFRIPAIEVPRIALIVAFGITASPTLARAEEASALGCINEMAVPVYGSIPWLAQISGTAMVIVRLDPSAKPLDIDVQSSHKALTDWVRGWLRKSTFLSGCAGKTVRLLFKYHLEGERRESPDNHVVVRFPGTFEITASPPVLHQTID